VCKTSYISKYMLRHAREGSILLLHMPEVGFREYNLQVLEKILKGLKLRGLRCVSLSQLERMSRAE